MGGNNAIKSNSQPHAHFSFTNLQTFQFMKLDLHWVGDRRTSPSPLQIQSFEEQSQQDYYKHPNIWAPLNLKVQGFVVVQGVRNSQIIIFCFFFNGNKWYMRAPRSFMFFCFCLLICFFYLIHTPIIMTSLNKNLVLNWDLLLRYKLSCIIF